MFQLFVLHLSSYVIQVLPSLWDKSDSSLLLELTNMWARYKKMANSLVGFFQYLERGRIDDSLIEMSARCFHDMVSLTMLPL